jgi:hypothetical protein
VNAAATPIAASQLRPGPKAIASPTPASPSAMVAARSVHHAAGAHGARSAFQCSVRIPLAIAAWTATPGVFTPIAVG